MKRTLQQNLPDDIKCNVVQTGTKLSQHFNVKDKVDGKHLSNFIYRRNCKNKKCDRGDDVGETARQRVTDGKENLSRQCLFVT